MTKQTTNNYTEYMQELEEILERIDQSEIPIDELANQVNRAGKLLKQCKVILKDTESSIKNVLEDLDTEFKDNE